VVANGKPPADFLRLVAGQATGARPQVVRFMPASGGIRSRAQSIVGDPSGLRGRGLNPTTGVRLRRLAVNEVEKALESAPPPRSRTRRSVVRRQIERSDDVSVMPMLLTVDDAANLLRTTRRAIYAMLERRQLPGVIRIRRRVLIRSAELLEWLDQKRAPSLKE
jgi:excisionase family DNA binding protein